jgi:hypothetical protein
LWGTAGVGGRWIGGLNDRAAPTLTLPRKGQRFGHNFPTW